MKRSLLDWVLLVVVAVVIALFTQSRTLLSDTERSAAEDAARRLTENPPKPRSTEGALTLIGSGSRFSVQEVVDSLPRSLWRQPVPVVISLGKVDRAAGLARGVDRNYHAWQSFLEGYRPFETDNPWLPLLVLAQRKQYAYDHDLYRLTKDSDIWQTSREAYLAPQGDCEDHAIVLADWLSTLGEKARVAVGTLDGGGHAWVVLFRKGREYLLEATQKHGVAGLREYPLAALKPEYRPRYQFDRQHFWTYTGTLPTTRYEGDRWERRSRFDDSL